MVSIFSYTMSQKTDFMHDERVKWRRRSPFLEIGGMFNAS